MSATSTSYRADDGSAYERFIGRWTRELARPFIEFARLPPVGDVLEVGCGTGSLALALAGQRPQARIFAIDVAEPYLAFARVRPGADRIRFEVGDACRLNFPSGGFSGVLAQLVLNFVPDPDVAVREMCRVSRRGGVVAGAVWDFRGGLVYQRLFWDTAVGVDPAAAAARDRLFSHPLALPDGLTDLWHRAGLTSIERDSITIRMAYANFNDYWEPLLGGQGPVGTYVQGLTPGMRERIEERVRGAYLSGATDGPRSLTATAWAVRGVLP